MNPGRIQEHIFSNARRGTFNDVYGFSDAFDFEKARFALLRCSLIKRNIQKKELWIHRVIQAEVRARMSEDERYEVFGAAVSLLATAWPPGDLCSQVSKRWEICENLLPHLERFHQLYMEYADAWSELEMGPEFLMLLNQAAV